MKLEAPRREGQRPRLHHESEPTPLMKRAVVSSFLYKFVGENGQRQAKVALFKRSDKVRTYP